MEKPNKISYAHIQELVKELTFEFYIVHGTTTHCVAAYKGFTLATGESGCIDPANFNKATGEKHAKERAIKLATDELWKNEGYRLKFLSEPFLEEQEK